MKQIIILASGLLLLNIAFSQKKPTTSIKPEMATNKKVTATKERLVQIKTDYGTMLIRLSDSTPLHRDNFIKLVKEGFYDSLLFHRVIEGFMIQGGDPNSKNADSAAVLGMGEAPGDRIPAEFKPNLIHKKGALAAARDDNPEKASSNCQFYIVQGKQYEDIELNEIECVNARKDNPTFYYTDAERNAYKSKGGTPFLDQNYTVFGEVIKGLDVIDKIAAVQKDANDRPLKNVLIKVEMLN